MFSGSFDMQSFIVHTRQVPGNSTSVEGYPLGFGLIMPANVATRFRKLFVLTNQRLAIYVLMQDLFM